MALALTLVAFALRVYDLAAQSLWVDEAFSVRLAEREPAEIVSTIANLDVHPPLHYLALHGWVALAGPSEFAVRYLSLAFSVLAVPLVFLLGSRMFGWRVSLVAAALAALSPFAVAYGQEARMYAMVAALSLASLVFYDGLLRGRHHAWLGYVVSTALSLYTQYYAALVILVENLCLVLLWLGQGAFRRQDRLIAHQRNLWGRWFTAQGVVALLFLPWLPVVVRPLEGWRNAWTIAPTVSGFAWQVWQFLAAGPAVDPQTASPALGALAAMLVIGLAVAVADGLVKRDRWPLTFASLGLLVPVAALFVISQARGIFQPKFLLMMAPLYWLLAAFAVMAVWRRRPWGGSLLLAGTVLVSVGGLAGLYWDQRFAKDPFRELAAYVARNAEADDVVIVDTPDAFGYYYRGGATWDTLPKDYPLREESLAVDLTRLTIGHGGQRIFLAQWSRDETDPKGFLRFLLDKQAQQLDRVAFGRQELWVYRLPTTPAFSIPSGADGRVALFDHELNLTAFDFGGAGPDGQGQAVPSGGKLWVILRWRLLQAVGRDLKVSLKLWGSNGHLAGQVDKVLWDNARMPTSHWMPGSEVMDAVILPVAVAVPPGPYSLELTVYDGGNGQPLPLVDFASGNATGLNLTLGRVDVTRQVAVPSSQGLADAMGQSLWLDVGPGLRLLGYDVPEGEISPGETIPVTFYWQALASSPVDYTEELTLVGPDGQVVTRGQAVVGGDYPVDRWVKDEVVRDWAGLRVPPTVPSGTYDLSLAVHGPGGAVLRQVTLARVGVSGRSRQFQAPPVQHRQEAVLGGLVRLVGWEVQPTDRKVKPGEVLHLTLVWQAVAPMDRSYTVFVHLVDESGKMEGQQDGIPGGGQLPTTGWLPGEYIVDTVDLIVRGDASEGRCRLAVGLYDLATSQRLSVADVSGAPLGDHVLLGPEVIHVSPDP